MKALASAFTLLAINATISLAGSFDFYEGDNGTQTKICTINDQPGQSFNLSKTPLCGGDEFRSVILNNIRAGAVLRVYDDPEGNPNKDDWAEVVVKRTVQQYTLHNFERTYEDDTVRVTYHRNNGLNGTVSHIRID